VTKLKISSDKYDGYFSHMIKMMVSNKKQYVFLDDEDVLKLIASYLRENRRIEGLHVGEETHLLFSTAYLSRKSLNKRILQKIDFM
jgi:hypothetical protein